ncbi:MAG: DNRLRE domain-containing protein [Nanoarchaeota archaeon]
MTYKTILLVLILLISVISISLFISPDASITGAAIGLQDTSDAIKDAYLKSGSNKKNYGISENLDVDKNDRNAIFEFNISSMGANATIHFATLRFYATDVTQDDKTAAIPIYRITRSWAEGTGDGQQTNDGATWKYYDNNDNWDSNGGDYDSFEWSSQNVTDQDQWYEWDVTQLARSWSNGTYDNYGILLLTESNNVGRKTFASSENSNSSIIPQLIINYSTPPVISNINSTSITHTTANIIWNTDDASNSTVNYGLTTALGNLSVNSDLETSHNIGLTNLQDNLTTYYYQVKSCNSQNLCAESSVSSFATLQNITAPDVTSPIINITAPQNITYNTQSINITYAATDDSAIISCWYSLGNTNVTTGSCENWTAILAEKQHTLYVYAEDAAENIGSSSVMFTINLQGEAGGQTSSSSSSSSSGGGSGGDGVEATRALITETAPQQEFIVANQQEEQTQEASNSNFFTGGVPLDIPITPESAGTAIAIIVISVSALIGYLKPSWLHL